MRAGAPARRNFVNDLESSEKLLKKQRFVLFEGWLHASQVTSAFNDFTQVLERRLKQMESQLQVLQAKIKEEDSIVSSKIKLLLENWNIVRPVCGGLNPTDALTTLSSYAAQVAKVGEDSCRLIVAKESICHPRQECLYHRRLIAGGAL
jgi:hypothetical protein